MADQPLSSFTSDDLEYSIKIIAGDLTIPLVAGKEYTLGRAVENHPIKPDIDLTPYNGYEEGVSRFHASITIYNNIPVIIDLGSTNGTKVNDQLILPYEPWFLSHGDILKLGNLKIKFLMPKSTSNIP